MKFLIHGERYLIKFKYKDRYCYGIRYWFNKRELRYWKCKDGFYRTEHYFNPCGEQIIKYVDFDSLPKFYEWKIENPIDGEKYLVYRVGKTSRCSPHYTIRKYHNGSFGSMDVKYWIKLSDIL